MHLYNSHLDLIRTFNVEDQELNHLITNSTLHFQGSFLFLTIQTTFTSPTKFSVHNMMGTLLYSSVAQNGVVFGDILGGDDERVVLSNNCHSRFAYIKFK